MTLTLGTVKPGSTILIPFNTFDSNDPSASVITSDFVLADIGIYKGTSMDERGSTTGVVLLDTDGINIDAAVGIHGFTIDLSSNATDDFYTAGSRYYVTVGPITVDSGAVSFVAATFEIGYPGAILDGQIATLASQTSFTITNAPTDDSALVGCPVIIHDQASATQFAIGYVSAYTTAANTITLKADPAIFTMAAGDNVSFFMPANVQAVAGTTQTALDINDILDDTAQIGTAGAGLTNINLPNQTMDITGDITGDLSGSVGSVTGAVGSVTGDIGGIAPAGLTNDAFADNAIDAAVLATDTITAAKIAANAIGASEIADGAIDAATFAAGAIDAAAIATDAIGSAELAASAVNEIVDQVWDEVRSGHVTAGTFGDSFQTVVNGAAEAGTLSTTEMTTDLTEATDEHYNGRAVIWTSGVLQNQASDITAYLGSTGKLTYTAVTEAPSAADTFIIY